MPDAPAATARRLRTTRLPLALVALVVAILLPALPGLPGTTQAAARLKAVIIVGPTHGLTASNLSRGEALAQLAASYGLDVRRVFHPRATWSAVLDNIQGASIVVYLGHGNGWPSPYSPFQTETKDGMGLNPIAGGSENTVKYYGEGPIAANVRLAPNAVVLLNHLCYASGNSEPGHAAPTQSVAKQRVDNYAAGFLRAGARAVFAYGYQSVAPVIRDLMTTHRTMDEIFMGTGYIGGRDIRFGSVRTPGYQVHMDPADATTYYRSVVGNLGLTADQVTGAPFANTDTTPADFVVPGAAVVDPSLPAPAKVMDAPAGANVTGTLAAGTAVRLAEGPVSGPDGQPWFRLDSPVAGWAAAASLDPADSTGPRAWRIDTGRGAFSPNGDGTLDTLPVRVEFSEAGTWWVRFQRLDGRTLKSYTGSGQVAQVAWNGTSGSTIQPDGTYRVSVVSTDAWGNVGDESLATIRLDTVAPTMATLAVGGSSVTVTTAGEPSPPTFSPNGDGILDTLPIGYDLSEPADLRLAVTDSAGAAAGSRTLLAASGPGTSAWDGKVDASGLLADGTYGLTITPVDVAGNSGASAQATARILTALRSPTASRVLFYARDRDSLAPYTTFRITLTRPASVTWRVLDSAGRTVATRWAERATTAGTYAWSWFGKDSTGAYVRDGVYVAVATATTPEGTIAIRKAVVLSAFRVIASDTTPARGQRITVTLISAEPLSRNPTLRVTQPGLTAYVLRTTKLSTYKYRVTFTLKTGGTTGKLLLRAYGIDTGYRSQATTIGLPLH
ncbi:MAG TPA: FlgD immunoglobulin-like domain containing protein [Candidatus Limnocylindrales bacterium]|nr:FlgD immunoglobulin-like domain containing protein [Candidatus Limnocylindrales bacterium]